jgi:hypothetical protein
MPLRDLLKKKDKHAEREAEDVPAAPEFKFYRSDTNHQVEIDPPGFDDGLNGPGAVDGSAEGRGNRLFKQRNRSVSNASGVSVSSNASDRPSSRHSSSKRLSERLHLRKSEATSASVPDDLPAISADAEQEGGDAKESQWEKRATILARKNEESRSRPSSAVGPAPDIERFGDMKLGGGHKRDRSVSSKRADDNIQEAIRLHEAGELEVSTKMFGRLADPNGENNALSQVLYGLALRYVQWFLHATCITPVMRTLNPPF